MQPKKDESTLEGEVHGLESGIAELTVKLDQVLAEIKNKEKEIADAKEIVRVTQEELKSREQQLQEANRKLLLEKMPKKQSYNGQIQVMYGSQAYYTSSFIC